MRLMLPLAPLILLAACQGEKNNIGDGAITKQGDAFTAITEQETFHFTGTEPFWGGNVTGETLLWNTPENPEGKTMTVQRFAGNNGLAYTGELGTAMFDMAVTKSQCSDGMSDRTYPFTVTVQISEQVRRGCGWTEARPFQGTEQP